jgi:hypothetical protein
VSWFSSRERSFHLPNIHDTNGGTYNGEYGSPTPNNMHSGGYLSSDNAQPAADRKTKGSKTSKSKYPKQSQTAEPPVVEEKEDSNNQE